MTLRELHVFLDRDGRRWELVGSHTSTTRLGQESSKHPDCPGCGTRRATA